MTKPDYEKFTPSCTPYELGSNSSPFSILLQPYYPSKTYISPLEIKNSINEIKFLGCGYEFPNDIFLEMIPYGTLSINWRKSSGYIRIEQLFGNGLIYHSVDVLEKNKDGKSNIWLSVIGCYIFVTLNAGSRYFKKIGYQGRLIGLINLCEVEDVTINPIVPSGWNYYGDKHNCLLSNYKWDIESDTSIIGDPQKLKTFFC